MELIHLLHTKNTLGEGPLWSVAEQALYWVDIIGERIHRYHPETGEIECFPQKEQISVVGFREKGGFIAAGKNGLQFWSPGENLLNPICDPERDRTSSRFNDGKVDRRGRFWAGTMTTAGAESTLYRLDYDLSFHIMETGVTISNGIGWSPDNQTMYFADTLHYVIYAYDFDLVSGSIQNRSVFASFEEDEGVPDGLTVDGEGHIWCAIWGGGKVIRFDPQGDVERVIPLPVTQPTSCCFGGKDLTDLFITSARDGLTIDERESQPWAGDIFMLSTDIKGIPEPEFLG